jgi:alpha-D-ribose 1-methylphosphonate 5-phosphate C-P lyase
LVFERFPGFALILPVTAKKMKMRMGYWCNVIQWTTTILGRKPDLVTLSSGQMSHELT